MQQHDNFNNKVIAYFLSVASLFLDFINGIHINFSAIITSVIIGVVTKLILKCVDITFFNKDEEKN